MCAAAAWGDGSSFLPVPRCLEVPRGVREPLGVTAPVLFLGVTSGSRSSSSAKA